MMFQESDLDRAGSLLNSILISVFIKKGITRKEFEALHTKYLMGMDTSSKKINYSKGNLRRALLNVDKPYSYKTFEFVLKNILRLNLVEMTCRFKTIDNKDETYVSKGLTY